METFYSYIHPFFGWLLRSTFQASIIVCLILLIQALLRNRLTARCHYALWLILIVRMVLPWTPQSRFSIYNFTTWQHKSNLPVTITSERDAEPTETPGGSSVVPQATVRPEPVEATKEQDRRLSVPAGTSRVSANSATSTMFRLSGILLLLWLAGALFLGSYIIICNLRLWRAASVECPSTDKETLELFEECRATIGLRTIVALVPSDTINTPVLLGFIRPRLLVPKGIAEKLNREELRYVFLHELSHVKRNDIAMGWLTALLQIIHWFNPLIWMAFHRMRSNRESACDALVLSHMKGKETQSYGRAIVSLLEHFSVPQSVPGLAGILETKSQLKRRIAMITKFRKKSYRWSPLAIILIVILACISLPDAKRSKASEAAALQPVNQPKFTKIQIPNRIPWDAQLSPDGKNIAFVNEKKIWIMPRSSRLGPDYPGAPKQLDTAGVEADWCGFTWSADGRWIAFNGKKVNEGNQCIYVVSADGGEPKQVYKNNRDVRVVNYRMSLSPHGETLAFTSVDANELHIYTIPVNGGQPKKLVDARAREPVFSPDGKLIAYVEDKALGRAGGGLWVVPAAGGTPTLVAEAGNASSPVWLLDGTMLAFADYAANKQIYIVQLAQNGNPDGKTITIGFPEGIRGVRRLAGWTPDNEIGVLFATQTEFALYTQPVQGGKATFITHGGYPVQPRWSPDGKRVYHTNETDVKSGDWRRAAIAYVPTEGGDVTTIPLDLEGKIRLWGYGTGNRISPNSKTIVFAGQKPQEGPKMMHIWTLPIEGGTPRQLTNAQLPFMDWYPCWSPDGRNIAFVRAKIPENWAVTGKANIYVISAEGGEPKQITSESDRVFDASPVIWSPDGKLLAYFSRDKDDASDGTIKVISPDGGEPRVVTRVEKIFANKEMAWSPDGKRIAYNARDNKIKIVSLDDGNIEEIQPDLKDVNIYHLDWSPDGENLVFGGYTGGGPEFWTVKNFLPETPVVKSELMTTVRRVGFRWRGPFANLSPDGKYISDRDWDTGTLVVHELATGKSRMLVGRGSHETGSPMVSAISPDSREVAFLWWDPNTRESRLYCAGLDGSGRRILRKGGYPMPRAWSADGQKILATVLENDVAQMVWISRSDGSIQHIVDVSLGYLGKVDISPDGHFIAYDRPQDEDNSKRDIFVFDLHENRELSIINHPADDKLLGWTPDGRHIFFASDRTGTWDAWLQPVVDGKPQGFPELARHGIGNITPIGFTPQGSYYFGLEQTLEDVFMARLDLETGEVLSEPTPVLQTGSTNCHDFSPDGQYLAYCERHSDKSQTIHIRTLATGRERTLSDNLPYIHWLRWSPGNRSFLIDGYKRGDSRGAIFKIDAQTGERTDLVRSPTEILIRPEMSPDGKTLFYTRGNNPRSGTIRLMASDLKSGHEKELFRVEAPARLAGSALSPDGKRIILSIVPGQTGPEGPVLKILSIADGQLMELLQFKKSENLRAVGVTWMSNSRNVLFWKWFQGDKERELYRISAEGGEPRKLWSRKTLGHMRIHPDGQHIAFYDRSTTRAVWVMEHFLPKAITMRK